MADGSVAIDLGVPEAVFGGPLSSLIEVFKHFDRFFQATAELAGAPRDAIRVDRASSSIITLILSTVQDHYQACIVGYSAIVEAALKTIEIYKAIADLRASKFPENIVEIAEEAQDKVENDQIDEMIDQLVGQFANIDDARKTR